MFCRRHVEGRASEKHGSAWASSLVHEKTELGVCRTHIISFSSDSYPLADNGRVLCKAKVLHNWRMTFIIRDTDLKFMEIVSSARRIWETHSQCMGVVRLLSAFRSKSLDPFYQPWYVL